MMTIAMARLYVRTTLNRIGRFDPDQAHELTEAIQLMIDDAVERAKQPGPPSLSEGPMGEGDTPTPTGGSKPTKRGTRA